MLGPFSQQWNTFNLAPGFSGPQGLLGGAGVGIWSAAFHGWNWFGGLSTQRSELRVEVWLRATSADLAKGWDQHLGNSELNSILHEEFRVMRKPFTAIQEELN